MRLLAIDHVILPTADVLASADRWRTLGLRMTEPMRHAGSSTENSVFFVGGATTEFYVELLGVHDPVLAAAEDRQDLMRAIDDGGLFRVMLQVESAGDAAAHLASHGIDTSSRDVQRSDGSPIGRVVEPQTSAAGCSLAFIEYEGGPVARIDRHREGGLFDHALPLQRLDHLAAITFDPDATCGFWADVLGVPVTGRANGRGMDIRQLRIGDATMELIGPDGADSPIATRSEGLISMAAF
ncbi:MAG: VOC family protein, partial [Actinomycetota bacterium]|nr:VOC family protein [Actinomycetota bacterium]